jgi:RNA polymerase sigma-70 factor (ECF subfamily)
LWGQNRTLPTFVYTSEKRLFVAETARNQVAVERSLSSDALEEAFACYQSELLGTLYHLVGNAEDARDALQDTFIKCWRNRHKLPDVHNVKAWIFRIALNTGRDMRQTAWRRRKRPLPEDEATLVSQQRRPEIEAEYGEQVSLVRAAVSQLRSEEQEVFLLRQNAQLTYEEIAAETGIPIGTVKTRMRLALSRLREALAPQR